MPLDRDLTFTLRPKNDGQTLATALRNILGPDHSWSDIRRLVSSRRVHLNGNLVLDDARKVKTGDVLHLFVHSRAPLPTHDDIPIRYLDEHLVIIEKPPGLNTLRHREESDLPQQRKDKAPTLDELLQRKLTDLYHSGQLTRPTAAPPRPNSRNSSPPPAHPLFKKSPAKTNPSRIPNPKSQVPSPKSPPAPPQIRPVHRLDRETSGLMLFALSPQAEQALERDFARHAITRKYLAIVQGHLTEKRTIESYLVRDRGDGKRGSSPLGPQAPESQRALTHVTPIETIAPKDSPLAHSIVECQLETGRTHQIRIHLSELGHPLAGEKTYLPPPTSTSSPSPLPPPHRHALHSAHLRLTHPITGHTLEYHSDLPKDLATWLKRLRDALRH